jgi:transcriptional regulator with XRE-family HTH domain
MTQQQVADAAGMNIRQIQKFESGERDLGNMTLRNALSLAKALGCEVSDFV